jgi:mannose/cellobiose epimerase-like protein (N-acyl-D-glucosamine 2-epimerase family)
MVERFGGQLGDAVRWIGTDCRRLVRCADAGHMLLRYEDRFFADSTQPGRLAAHFGLAVDGSTCRALAERYSTTEVGAFAATLSELPADRVIRNERLMFDRVTQIHRTHIGDGRIGKWRDRLAPQVRAEITRYFEPFLTRFGYEQA